MISAIMVFNFLKDNRSMDVSYYEAAIVAGHDYFITTVDCILKNETNGIE